MHDSVGDLMHRVFKVGARHVHAASRSSETV